MIKIAENHIMNNIMLKFEKMRKLVPIFIMLSLSTNAQPYLDLGQISYHNSPGGEPKEFQHFRYLKWLQ